MVTSFPDPIVHTGWIPDDSSSWRLRRSCYYLISPQTRPKKQRVGSIVWCTFGHFVCKANRQIHCWSQSLSAQMLKCGECPFKSQLVVVTDYHIIITSQPCSGDLSTGSTTRTKTTANRWLCSNSQSIDDKRIKNTRSGRFQGLEIYLNSQKLSTTSCFQFPDFWKKNIFKPLQSWHLQ